VRINYLSNTPTRKLPGYSSLGAAWDIWVNGDMTNVEVAAARSRSRKRWKRHPKSRESDDAW